METLHVKGGRNVFRDRLIIRGFLSKIRVGSFGLCRRSKVLGRNVFGGGTCMLIGFGVCCGLG